MQQPELIIVLDRDQPKPPGPTNSDYSSTVIIKFWSGFFYLFLMASASEPGLIEIWISNTRWRLCHQQDFLCNINHGPGYEGCIEGGMINCLQEAAVSWQYDGQARAVLKVQQIKMHISFSENIRKNQNHHSRYRNIGNSSCLLLFHITA